VKDETEGDLQNLRLQSQMFTKYLLIITSKDQGGSMHMIKRHFLKNGCYWYFAFNQMGTRSVLTKDGMDTRFNPIYH